jgi:hypothetical protein
MLGQDGVRHKVDVVDANPRIDSMGDADFWQR